MTIMDLHRRLRDDEKDTSYLSKTFLGLNQTKERIEKFDYKNGDLQEYVNLLSEKKAKTAALTGFINGLAVMDYITLSEYGQLLERVI